MYVCWSERDGELPKIEAAYLDPDDAKQYVERLRRCWKGLRTYHVTPLPLI